MYVPTCIFSTAVCRQQVYKFQHKNRQLNTTFSSLIDHQTTVSMPSMYCLALLISNSSRNQNKEIQVLAKQVIFTYAIRSTIPFTCNGGLVCVSVTPEPRAFFSAILCQASFSNERGRGSKEGRGEQEALCSGPIKQLTQGVILDTDLSWGEIVDPTHALTMAIRSLPTKHFF